LDLLRPLAGLFGAAAGLKNLAYDHGWVRGHRLRWPVVSVGNLSVGGAGKTPVVIRLAELLGECGVRVSVLSRGYGRDSRAVEFVDLAGSAERFGDEPLLMARRLGSDLPRSGARVVVGADRYSAGLLAESLEAETADAEPGNLRARSVHVLDDGFQHRRLARDLDVVVVHRSDFEGRLLPAGRLREGLGSLRRASVVVLREEDAELEYSLRALAIKAPVWFVRRSVSVPVGPGRVVAFCGTARPAEFFNSLRAAGKMVVGERAFRDHHQYSVEDVTELRRLAVECGAGGFVTTEKDAVRFSPELLERLSGGSEGIPMMVAELKVRFRDEDAVVEELLRVIYGCRWLGDGLVSVN
jgi:tetraacyldisaccharide 4'-kinase